jgi:ankyrin repeat protein
MHHVLSLSGKVDVNVCNSKGESALCVAAREGFPKIAQTLLDAAADADFVCQNPGQHTPLIVASVNDHLNVIKVLLKVREPRATHAPDSGLR